MRRVLALLLFATLATAPLATAASSVSGRHAWADAWARAPDADLAAAAKSAAACAMGDIDADGVSDLLLRTKDKAGAKLQALSGADPTVVLWESALDARSRLTCASDVGGDGIADPVIESLRSAGNDMPDVDGFSSSEGQATLHALDGLTGKTALSLEASESVRGGEAPAATGSTTTDVTLELGAEDLYLFVTSERTSAAAELLGGLMLSGGDADVVIEILDAAGEKLGTIEAPDARSDILSHAVVRDAPDKARILVLSATDASPIDQAPARVPTIASHAIDGSVAWTVELQATTGDMLLIPRAGDFDADGVQDLIVETVPMGVPLEGGSALAVLSGVDGSILVERVSEAGLLAGLPLGDLTPDVPTDGDALLVMVQEKAGAPIQLECLREGVSCWTAELPAGSVPVNGALDPFTGDLQGFTDLTGDGIPDVATLAEGDASATLHVASGVDGARVWAQAVDAGSRIVPLPDLDGVDLLVLGPVDETRKLALSRIDGATGRLQWSVEADISSELQAPEVDIETAERALSDGRTKAETIVATVRDAEGGALSPEHVYAIDPSSGSARWAGATVRDSAVPPQLEVVSDAETPRDVAPVPGAGLVALVGAVGAVALAARRRKAP